MDNRALSAVGNDDCVDTSNNDRCSIDDEVVYDDDWYSVH